MLLMLRQQHARNRWLGVIAGLLVVLVGVVVVSLLR
jgi:glucose uptake protein GlcU